MYLQTPQVTPTTVTPAEREPPTPAMLPAEPERDAVVAPGTASVFGELESMLGGVTGDDQAPWWTADPSLEVGVVDREDPDSKSKIKVTDSSVEVDGPVGAIGVSDGRTDLGLRLGATPATDDAPASKGVLVGGSVIYDSEASTSEERAEDGTLLGRRRDHSLRLGGGANVDAGLVGVAGEHVAQDKASGFVVAREDGTTPSDDEVDARIERIVDRDAGETPEEVAAAVTALVTDVASWEAGDSVRTDESARTSIDAKLSLKAVSGSVSAGGSYTDRAERTVESLGEGRVRVTLTQSDEAELHGGVAVAEGVASLTGEVAQGETATQSVELDLTTAQGQADFAVLQYTGMLPGSAEALGIETPEEAAAFLAMGGMDAVADGRWQVPEASAELAAGGKDALNEHLLDGAGTDPRYVEVSEGDTSRSEVGLTVAGFDIASRESESSHEVIRTIGPDGEEVVTRNEETVSTSGLLVEDGTAYAGSAIDADGAYVLRTASTYDDAIGDSDTALARRIAANPDLAAAADDPRATTTVTGVTEELVAGLAAAEVDAGEAREIANLWLGMGGSSEAIAAAAERAGLTPEALVELTGGALTGLLEDPDSVTDLSPAVAEAYAALALEALGPDGGLDALADIADHASPEATAAAVSAVIASGVEVTPALLTWAAEHGVDLGTITTEAVAGSTDARAVLEAAATGEVDEAAGADLVDALKSLTDTPEDLDLMLDGLEQTAGLSDLLTALPAGMGGELLELAGDHPGVREAAAALLADSPAALLPRLEGDALVDWVDQHLGDLLPEGTDADALVARARADVLGSVDAEAEASLLQATGYPDLESLFEGYGPAQIEELLQSANIRAG